MNKKIVSMALSAVMVVSALSLLTACGGGNAKEDVVKLKTTAPICFIANDYTDSSITSSTFTVEYDAKYNLTAALADESLGTLTEVSSSTSDGKVTATYKMDSAKVVGSSVVNFTEKDKVVDTVPVAVKSAYPEDGFKTISSGNAACYSHDPVVMEVPEGYEVNGETYYYFSYCTDNDGGGYGVPVKGSKDLVEWKRLGSAIPGFGTKAKEVKESCEKGTNELQKVYDVLSADSDWGKGVWTLWAPEVVRAPDGGYWLYGSWTTAFGSRRSVIFQCYSKSPVGPFEFKDIVVYSPSSSNNGKQSNAIDPSIFYDTDGEMYMSYGSFSDFRVIPLDKNTGFRKDKAKFSAEEMTKAQNFYSLYYKTYKCDWSEDFDDLDENEKYFGEMVLKNTGIEGSVIEYFADVPVYKGDVNDFDESKLTYESNYYMVGSANSLSADYSMRVYKSATPVGTYLDCYGGTKGSVISATYSWAESEATRAYPLNYFVPGHNDLLTNSANEHFIVYHNRVVGKDKSFGTDQHYLTTSLIAFNSKGDMVMSPVRYTGESLRKVTADEITKYSNGNYLGIVNSSKTFGVIQYAEKYSLSADGSITGAAEGTWRLYGDNYIYITLDGIEYYGVVMPGYCVKSDSGKKGYVGKGGLVISAIGNDGDNQKTLFMEMTF